MTQELNPDYPLDDRATAKRLEAEIARLSRELIERSGELQDWRDMFAAAAALPLPEELRRIKLWPNKWHPDCAAIALLIDQQATDSKMVSVFNGIAHEIRGQRDDLAACLLWLEQNPDLIQRSNEDNSDGLNWALALPSMDISWHPSLIRAVDAGRKLKP